MKIEKFKEILKTKTGYSRIYLTINTFDHGRDGCGNGTAHYQCVITIDYPDRFELFDACESGKRREQVGYTGENEAAKYKLEKLGYKIELFYPSKNYARDRFAHYKITNLGA
jgi:hypothetical protein